MSESALFDMADCTLCPRECHADRVGGRRGFCGMPSEVYVSLAALHRWEEPTIAGEHGAGTVFFAGCPLGCVYCQNYAISAGTQNSGAVFKKVSVEDLARIFLELQEKKAATLDLVTPTHYAPPIAAALRLAKGRGLNIPVVYNCSGYEKTSVVAALAAVVDIFLPDFKYFSPETAAKYSKAADYPAVALAAVGEMVRQKGRPAYFDGKKTRLKSGVVVRHLVLPGHHKESVALVRALYENFGDAVILSLLRQYTPTGAAGLAPFPNLRRRLTTFEYGSVADAAYDAGFRAAFVQEKGSADESFIPAFDGRGI